MYNQEFNPETPHSQRRPPRFMPRGMHHHDGAHDAGHPDVPGEGRGPRGQGRGPRGEGRSRGFGPGRGFGGFGPGFGGPGFVGFGPGFGPGFGGGRVRKGNVRSAILSLLSQSSYNGYGIIKAIALHTDGAWRPSPGSVYPTLSALQAENLITAVGEGRKTEFALTDSGRAFVSEHSAEMTEVWADVSEEAGVGVDLRQSLGKLMGAVQQVSVDSDEEKIKAATAALNEARRTIYQLLSD